MATKHPVCNLWTFSNDAVVFFLAEKDYTHLSVCVWSVYLHSTNRAISCHVGPNTNQNRYSVEHQSLTSRQFDRLFAICWWQQIVCAIKKTLYNLVIKLACSRHYASSQTIAAEWAEITSVTSLLHLSCFCRCHFCCCRCCCCCCSCCCRCCCCCHCFCGLRSLSLRISITLCLGVVLLSESCCPSVMVMKLTAWLLQFVPPPWSTQTEAVRSEALEAKKEIQDQDRLM